MEKHSPERCFPLTKAHSRVCTPRQAWPQREGPCPSPPRHSHRAQCRWESADGEPRRVWPCRAPDILNTDRPQKNGTLLGMAERYFSKGGIFTIPNPKMRYVQCWPIWDAKVEKQTIETIRSGQRKPRAEPSSKPIYLRVRNSLSVQRFKLQLGRSLRGRQIYAWVTG